MLHIDLKDKFTSIHFELVLSKYWKASFEEKSLEFNLSRLEWIAIEQVTFLISWINELAAKSKYVALLLPTQKDILTTDPVFERRQKCLNYLLIDWNLLDFLDGKVQIISGDISPTRKPKGGIPYHKVEIRPYSAKTFDLDFYELYNTDFKRFIKYIESEIKENTLLNYFDNHFLHYSIIKEFYSNTCQHAYAVPKNEKCFFSIKSNNKIDDKRIFGNVLKQKLEERYSERPKEEQAFFQNKKGEYLNTSFIEINFLDFGVGIVNTLKNKYLEENIELLKDKLSPNHEKQNQDTRILEYSFLLFTSKYELGKDFEMHDYIPRGLYIIKDIVKRYSGMIIARSGKGKVIFNCNTNNIIDEVVFREGDKDEVIGEGFPGTSITLILPSKDKEKISYYERKIKDEKKPLPAPHIINLLSFFNRISSSSIVINQTQEDKKRIKFIEEFFRTICNELLKYKSPDGDLVLFDFAGVERTSQDIFIKFLYFLAYCPLVSDKINVCLFNLVEKGINQALLVEESLIKKSKGFFIKPIPCVYPDMAVRWIGITESDFENRVNEVWKENTSKSETFSDIHHLAGNVLRITFEDRGRIEFAIQIQSFFSITKLIYNHHKSFIENELTEKLIEFQELKNEDHNYNKVLNTKYEVDKNGYEKQRAFLTSNGKYQKEFLSFVEKLYIREYRRLISTYLLFNFCYENTNNDDEIDAKEITKILTVTLSSQLLGKEFTEIVNDLGYSKRRISLIPLSNYYDFNTEEPFNEVNEGDRIIVVNDVISTGNLSRKIIKSVEEKKAVVTAIMTIVDSRTNDEKKVPVDSRIITLTERPVKKYQDNPFDTNPIWINPILNAPTTMSRVKSNKESILKTPQEFINFFKDDNFFKVGLFQQNTRHLTYYLQTDDFFKEEQKMGFPVLSEILKILKNRISAEKNQSLESDLSEIRRIQNIYNAQYISSNEKKTQSQGKHKVISKSFKVIEEFLMAQLSENQQYYIFETEENQFIDFIFYPFLSSVSEIEKNLNPITFSLRGSHSIEIYPLPRIMTPKGWRFSFPPKFLNFHTKDKSALILDDGSCTGETIIQMINSLSFLELNEVFVLSIFGRLEDFQREFLSRIKQVKVKDISKGYKIIPVSVFFGTHFHIPVFNKNNHPSRAELKEMYEIENLYKEKENELPTHLKEYINKRKEQILKPINPKYSNDQFTLTPRGVNRRLMFVVRDLIGNFDSYRLFKEDEIGFNETIQDRQILSSLKDILSKPQGRNSLIAVLIEEPYLTDTIKRIYPEILSDEKEENNLRDFIVAELRKSFSDIGSEYLNFYLVGLYTVDYESYFNYDFLISLFERIEELKSDDSNLLNYIGYIFSTILFNTKQRIPVESYFNAKLVIQKLYLYINDTGNHGKKYAGLIKELYNESLIALDDFPSNLEVKLIFKVQRYYLRQVTNQKQDVDSNNSKQKIRHPNYYGRFGYIINSLGRYADNPMIKFEENEKDSLRKDLMELVEIAHVRLFIDLKPVLNFLEPFFLNNDFGIDISFHKKLLDEFEQLQKSLKNEESFKSKTLSNQNLNKFIIWLEKFNESFFRLSNQLPKFFIKATSNLSQVAQSTLKEYESLNGNSNIQFDIPSTVNLSIHPYLLRLIFMELMVNKSLHASKATASIYYFEDTKNVTITYVQSEGFEEDKNESGLITIRNIISRYAGKTRTKSKPNYEIEIILPIAIKN